MHSAPNPLPTFVLYLKNLQGRGVQKVYLNWARGLQKLGCTVHLVIREPRIEFDISDIQHLHIFEQDLTAQLDALCASLPADTLLIANDATRTAKLKQIATHRIYHTVHMLWGERVIRQLRLKKWWQLRRDYRNKHVLVVSEAVKHDLSQRIRIRAQTIQVIRDGFDLELIRQKAQEPAPLPHQPYLISVGALSREKNHPLLLDSFAKLTAQWPDLQLVILGQGQEQTTLQKQAQHLGISAKVHWLGFQSNPYPWIAQARLCCITSSNEAFPGVAIESLVLGTPVVSTDCKGIREILTQQLAHCIVDKPAQYSTTLATILTQPPQIDPNAWQAYDYTQVARQFIDLATTSAKNDSPNTHFP